MSVRLTHVQHEPVDLAWRVEGLTPTYDSSPLGGPGGNWQDHTSEILDFTRKIFPGMVTLAEMDDPEIPDHRYLVFQVTAHGSVEQLAAQNDEWHRRLCELPGRTPGRYRLSILTD